MKTFYMSKKEFTTLEHITLDSGVVNTMAEIYHMPKDADEVALVFKKFRAAENDYFINKVNTIVSLMEQQRCMAVAPLVYPCGLVSIDHELSGYAMPFIEGINLKTLLNDTKVPFAKKKSALVQVGEILEQMKSVRAQTPYKDFYLNDIHESNFIVDTNDQVHFVDLDSCSINGNHLDKAMYLRPVSKFKYYNKYSIIIDDFFGYHIKPSDDSEIYSYAMMILNTIAKETLGIMDSNTILDYLTYLEELDYPPDFIYDLVTLYSTSKPNNNPYKKLELLPYIPNSSFAVFNHSGRRY